MRTPFWLRRRTRPVRPRPTPREARWWIGVVWMFASVLLLGFVAHATLFGALQHDRRQSAAYDELRTMLAKAEAPLGQLGVNEELVPSGRPVALLEIDEIGLTEVIVQGTSPEQLREGVGHRRDTVMPGQDGTSVLYGRQSAFGGPFGGIGALEPGDRIRVTTGQDRFTFEVLGTRRPGDPLPEPPGEDEGRLTLVTADGPVLWPEGVLYVDAMLDGEPAETPAFVFISAALETGEREMETDPDAWLPFLFSLQWLLIAAIAARLLLARWGRWQTWIVAMPTLLFFAAITADAAMALLPNLI